VGFRWRIVALREAWETEIISMSEIQNKFPGKDVTAEDLETKFPWLPKSHLITFRSLKLQE